MVSTDIANRADHGCALPPRISIVIPSFNAAPWIGDALNSALLQEPSPYQVIVQDGGSQDGTLAVLQSFGSCLTYQSERDRGQADALNRALARTGGDVIGWLNADDTYAPNAFRIVEETFARNASIDIVYGDFGLIDGTGAEFRRYRVSEWKWERFLSHGCYVFSGATFFRRSVFERFGLFDIRLHHCMDFDFMLRIGQSVTAVHVPEVLGYLRLHDESKTGSAPLQFVKEGNMVRRRHHGRSLRNQSMSLYGDAVHLSYVLTRRLWLSDRWKKVRTSKRL